MLILQVITPLREIGSDHTKLAILHYTANDKHPLWSRSVGQMVATDTARVQIASVFHPRYSIVSHKIKMSLVNYQVSLRS